MIAVGAEYQRHRYAVIMSAATRVSFGADRPVNDHAIDHLA